MTGDDFRARRQQAGLSIRGAATLLSTTPQSIQRWESGGTRIPSEAAERIGAESNDADVLTKSERQELAGLLRRRARVAKADAKQRTAELLADFEAGLATIQKSDDAAWRDITATAQAHVREADAAIAAICREKGIPEDWRPGLRLDWYGRGENASASRRAELRRVATSRLAALEQAAVAAIERQAVAAETELIAEGMRSTRARALLTALPTVEALMPPLDVAAVAAAVPGNIVQRRLAEADGGLLDLDAE